MGRIVVLGSANMDLVVRQPRRARAGETMFGTAFATGPGGKGLNQAVAAARAGASVAFIGAVGADDFGVALRSFLQAEGVDVSRLPITDHSTGIAQITVTDDGENSIVVVPGANDRSLLDAGDRDAIAGASHLVVQLERPASLLVEAMAFARSHAVTTVLTPAPVSDGIDALVELADILIPNEGEAAQLSGEMDAEAAARALSLIATTVVVTLGARGAIVARHGELVARVDAHDVAPVDTTAAGDTFTGVLVARLADGIPLESALQAASAAAAISVTRRGAAESMPFAGEIDERLASAATPSPN
ncbi:ribokinase [Microbacterium sp. CFBP9034]|uniref:ribokinase n=1 Tax=Microbacterium sp. CFBP9034 TaxID=3096540 RepID=UPI002A6AA43E|nr:ribokinase [Microbacterium sp. CFBP9034]MDY0908204.1 ribokinase [Microbacterium sp. CFBP9034]